MTTSDSAAPAAERQRFQRGHVLPVSRVEQPAPSDEQMHARASELRRLIVKAACHRAARLAAFGQSSVATSSVGQTTHRTAQALPGRLSRRACLASQ